MPQAATQLRVRVLDGGCQCLDLRTRASDVAFLLTSPATVYRISFILVDIKARLDLDLSKTGLSFLGMKKALLWEKVI